MKRLVDGEVRRRHQYEAERTAKIKRSYLVAKSFVRSAASSKGKPLRPDDPATRILASDTGLLLSAPVVKWRAASSQTATSGVT